MKIKQEKVTTTTTTLVLTTRELRVLYEAVGAASHVHLSKALGESESDIADEVEVLYDELGAAFSAV